MGVALEYTAYPDSDGRQMMPSAWILLSKPLHGASYKDKWGPEEDISLPVFPQVLGSPESHLVTDTTKESL